MRIFLPCERSKEMSMVTEPDGAIAPSSVRGPAAELAGQAASPIAVSKRAARNDALDRRRVIAAS